MVALALASHQWKWMYEDVQNTSLSRHRPSVLFFHVVLLSQFTKGKGKPETDFTPYST